MASKFTKKTHRDAFRILSEKGVTLEAIIAQTQEGLIGIGEEIPWHLPEDLHFFKQRTLGSQLIMGRKTFANIVERLGRPLPGRKSIVLSRSLAESQSKTDLPEKFAASFSRPFGASPEEALDFVCDPPSALEALDKNRAAFVIGGAQIYAVFEDWIRRACITLVSFSDEEVLVQKEPQQSEDEFRNSLVYYNALERLQARGLQIMERRHLSPTAEVLFLQG